MPPNPTLRRAVVTLAALGVVGVAIVSVRDLSVENDVSAPESEPELTGETPAPSEKPMRVGQLELPDPHLPGNLDAAFQRHVELTGDDNLCSIANDGLNPYDKNGQPLDLASLGATATEIALHGALLYLREEPDNGLRVLPLAWAYAENGDVDGAVAALEQMSRLGGLGVYDVSYEDPHFNAGRILADAGRLREALQQYCRVLKREIDRKGPVWAHVGSVHHEISEFPEAAQAYERALAEMEEEARSDAELDVDTSAGSEATDLFGEPGEYRTELVERVRRCLEAARREEAVRVSRTEHGLYWEGGNE